MRQDAFDVVRVLSQDFVVTDSTTLATVPELSFYTGAGEMWAAEWNVATSATDTTTDIDFEVRTTGTWSQPISYYKVEHFAAASLNAVGPATVVSATSVLATASVTGGLNVNNGDNVVRTVHLECWFSITQGGSIVTQIANNGGGGTRISRLLKGSMLRAKLYRPSDATIWS